MDYYTAVNERVKKELSCSAHDLEHVRRVEQLCLRLAGEEPGVDLEILRLSALLHDIARVREDRDQTGRVDHALLGGAMSEEILTGLGMHREMTDRIKHCVVSHRFRGAITPGSPEARILFDADKLDVLGAIGIARSFIITGQYGEPVYSHIPLSDYIRDNLTGGVPSGRVIDIRKHAANLEFELKLRHIPERLFTPAARKIAEQRIRFMTNYFDRLKSELTGEA